MKVANCSLVDKTFHIHHVPGRLRLWVPQLRRSRRGTQAACDTVATIAGVSEVRANPATGSLTILYDRERLHLEVLWHALCERDLATGFLPIAAGSCVTRAEIRLARHPNGEILDAILGAFVDKLVTRSVIALVGALI